MKAQGFTLIELLAVIVILAIIALIATPIVLGIISDTKESAQIRSSEMYLKGVANALMKENLEQEGNFKPTECTITSEGNLDCDDKEGILEVEVDGEKPKNGNITFEEGKIKEVRLEYANAIIVKNEEGNLVYSDEQSGSGSEEEETLAPGLYDAEGNMTISWADLVSKEYKTIQVAIEEEMDPETGESVIIYEESAILNVDADGTLTSSFSEMDQVNASLDYLIGHLIVNESVNKIGWNTFRDCFDLTEITIPNSVSSIGSDAFASCTSLATINYNGTQDQWNSIQFNEYWNSNCPKITVHCTDGDIVIPASS